MRYQIISVIPNSFTLQTTPSRLRLNRRHWRWRWRWRRHRALAALPRFYLVQLLDVFPRKHYSMSVYINQSKHPFTKYREIALNICHYQCRMSSHYQELSAIVSCLVNPFECSIQQHVKSKQNRLEKSLLLLSSYQPQRSATPPCSFRGHAFSFLKQSHCFMQKSSLQETPSNTQSMANPILDIQLNKPEYCSEDKRESKTN